MHSSITPSFLVHRALRRRQLLGSLALSLVLRGTLSDGGRGLHLGTRRLEDRVTLTLHPRGPRLALVSVVRLGSRNEHSFALVEPFAHGPPFGSQPANPVRRLVRLGDRRENELRAVLLAHDPLC